MLRFPVKFILKYDLFEQLNLIFYYESSGIIYGVCEILANLKDTLISKFEIEILENFAWAEKFEKFFFADLKQARQNKLFIEISANFVKKILFTPTPNLIALISLHDLTNLHLKICPGRQLVMGKI